jgi:phage nucleotide-binding protein
MKPLSAKNLKNKPYFICVYGASGVGKTSLAKTLPGRTLVADAESGLQSIAGTDVDYISLAYDEKGNFISQTDRYARLVKFMEYTASAECRATYQNIIIDSLTEIGQCVSKMMEQKYPADNFKRWGEYGTAMQDFIKHFRDMSHYTTVFIALEDRVDEEDGTSQYVPSVGGKKVKGFILPAFDAVLRMIVDKDGARKFICRTTAKTQAKVRCTGVNEVENAHLGELITKIKGESK